jgi:hypothetical protein
MITLSTRLFYHWSIPLKKQNLPCPIQAWIVKKKLGDEILMLVPIEVDTVPYGFPIPHVALWVHTRSSYKPLLQAIVNIWPVWRIRDVYPEHKFS